MIRSIMLSFYTDDIIWSNARYTDTQFDTIIH